MLKLAGADRDSGDARLYALEPKRSHVALTPAQPVARKLALAIYGSN